MLVLFDIDGTLLDEEAAERAGVAALRASAGFECSLDELAGAWAAALDTHFERYLRGEIGFQEHRRARIREVLGRSLDDDAADTLFAEYLGAHELAWRAYSDAVPCLDALAGHTLGVVSNGQGEQQRRKLQRTGIADRFECIVISEEAGQRKPEAGIFLRACAELRGSPADAVYIGDGYETDALGARRAGLIGVWLDRSGRPTVGREPPVVAGLDEFVEFVTRRSDQRCDRAADRMDPPKEPECHASS